MDMTFTEKVQEFFEPIRQDKIVYLRPAFEGILDGLYLVSGLFFFEKIGYSIQQLVMDDFQRYLFVYGIISMVYFFIKVYVIHWGWPNICKSIDAFASEKYLARFMQAEPNLVEKIGTGRFLQIYKSGTRVWIDAIHSFLSSDLALIVVSIYGIIRVGQFSVLYGMSIIVILALLVYLMYQIDIHFTIPFRKKRVEIETEYGRVLARIFMSKMEYLQNNEFQNEQKKLTGMLEGIWRENHGIDNSVGGMFIVIRSISVLLRFAVYIFIGNAIFQGSANFWTLSIYIMIVTMLETTLRTVYDSFRKLTRDGQHIEKLWTTFNSLTPIKGYSTGLPFSPHPQHILLKDISYSYNETPVFQNLSLTIERGKKTALVGASGGGKTTLMKLIAGYLHPLSGSISVLGNKLDETALKTYYPHIGYLTQDPGVFDATIRENLMSAISSVSDSDLSSRRDPFQNHLGEKDNIALVSEGKRDSSAALRSDKGAKEGSESTDQQLIQALRLAHCDFVFELEHGLDTEIGERGVRLSGGQKQRLAIAKIFLKNPEIILLDEPTSALDSFSEEKITEALDILFKDRTVIIVAHRLQTVKKADTILVLEHGKITEQGTHQELVAHRGIYSRMLELQSGF